MGGGATAVELPYAAVEATGLDEARHPAGAVPFSVKDGRTRIGRFPAGVVSCRIRRVAKKQ